MTDDETRRPSRTPSLLVYESKASGMTTSHTRSKSKLANVHIRGTTVARVDVGAEIVCLRLAAGQMTRNEWQSYIALREGILFHPLRPGAMTRSWFVVPPPAKTATAEVCGRHYGMNPATVERYERSARHILHALRSRAGLTNAVPFVPIWPIINSDERLLQYLFSIVRESEQ